jgi:hypothetical protein
MIMQMFDILDVMTGNKLGAREAEDAEHAARLWLQDNPDDDVKAIEQRPAPDETQAGVFI